MLNKNDILTLIKKLIIKILNLKLLIIWEYQNIKTFLQKNALQVVLKKCFYDKKKLKCCPTICKNIRHWK